MAAAASLSLPQKAAPSPSNKWALNGRPAAYAFNVKSILSRVFLFSTCEQIKELLNFLEYKKMLEEVFFCLFSMTILHENTEK